MSTAMLISLAQRFHAFSGSALKTSTLPTLGASSDVAGDRWRWCRSPPPAR